MTGHAAEVARWLFSAHRGVEAIGLRSSGSAYVSRTVAGMEYIGRAPFRDGVEAALDAALIDLEQQIARALGLDDREAVHPSPVVC